MMKLHSHSTTRSALTVIMVLVVAATADTAQATGACSVSSSGLVFGAYQQVTFADKVSSVDAFSTASVALVCTGTTGGGYTISLGPSTDGPGDRTSVRYLANSTHGGDPMAFNIFTDPGYNAVWGDGIRGVMLRGVMPTNGGNQTQTVYGKVPAGQTRLRAGDYAGSMTITVSYDP